MPEENKGFITFRKTQDYRIIVSFHFEGQGKKTTTTTTTKKS